MKIKDKLIFIQVKRNDTFSLQNIYDQKYFCPNYLQNTTCNKLENSKMYFYSKLFNYIVDDNFILK